MREHIWAIAGAVLCMAHAADAAPSAISAVWANDGEDKVTREELRATLGPRHVANSVWDGTTIRQFAAKNEVVAFNVILEAGGAQASGVSVALSDLVGPGGARIRSNPNRPAAQLFNYTTSEVELFYVRYLQIKGLGVFTQGLYGIEPQIPQKLRLPRVGGVYGGGWVDRPNHDHFYPDIAVPLELVRGFAIAAGQNQSIWADIYVPATAPAGAYAGTFSVSENGISTHQIPVSLTVRNFALPDAPTAKTMVETEHSDVSRRYAGIDYPNPGTPEYALSLQVMQNQRLQAHRHKIALIGDDATQAQLGSDRPGADYVGVLSGAAFTAANGYAGPGAGTGSGIYSIGTYGSWQYSWGATQAALIAHTDAWEGWFEANFPGVERFLYLIDESSNFAQTEQWANWMANNPGIGRNLPSMATINLRDAVASVPDLGIPTTGGSTLVANPAAFQADVDAIHAQEPKKRFYMYNGYRPMSGSFGIEDEGTSLREVPWGQYAKGVDRWFFWEATYYKNYQYGLGDTDVFNVAETFGGPTTFNVDYGQLGANSSNGDGVLFYPGTDAIFPASSYGVAGPFASLRLKHWRRGIQDADYLALAAAKDSATVQALVKQMVPVILWDIPVGSKADPTWTRSGIHWSDKPDVWEAARARLAHIIDGQ